MVKPLNVHPDSEGRSDDQSIGRVLSRREILALLGANGAALLCGVTFTDLLTQTAAVADRPAEASTQAANAAMCVVQPQCTQGPSLTDNRLHRADIRTELSDGPLKEGIPLRLIVKLFDVSSGQCTAIEGAQIDVWHCDAQGVYSDMEEGQIGLRGYQFTDEMGTAQFSTIYPGWYSGRAVHIHFKVRTGPTNDSGYEFASQFFFDEPVTARVYKQPPYASKGQPDWRNDSDKIFQSTGSMLTLLPMQDTDGGFTATMEIGMDLRS